MRDGADPVPVDAIVHLAAIPAPGILSDVATYRNNSQATFNVFHAAQRAGVKNIVYASSETVLGLPFDVPPPYIPVDEEYPARPESVYSLNKHLEEQMAIQLVRWDPSLKIYGLRFSNVMDVADYAGFPAFDADPMLRKWNLWGYIDGRDGAQAVRKALEAKGTGFEAFIHRVARHGHVPAERRARRGGLPRCRDHPRAGRPRHHAVDRQGAAPARLRPAALLARRGLTLPSGCDARVKTPRAGAPNGRE